ncbi:MAG: response regulator [Deltaproteobacteria bacterium]|nr:response regulator [Deltaproteobacteria bacterium]
MEKVELAGSGCSGKPPYQDQALLLHELRTHQLELELQNEELRRSQAELARSQSRLADLYDFAPVAYLSLDERGLISEINLRGAELLGEPRRLLVARAWVRFIHSEDQDAYYHCRKRLLKSREPQGCELRLQKKDGRVIFALVKLALDPELDGDSGGFRLAVTDITAGKVLENLLRQKEDELFQARKMEAIGLLAGGIAHDFNNVLTIILAGTELLQQLLGDGEPLVAQTLADVVGAVQRSAGMVRQILTFSRKDMQSLAPLRPHPVVKESLRLLRSTLPTTIIFIEKLDGFELEVMAAPAYIQQLVVNLCLNGAQALAREKGTLTISTGKRQLRPAEIAGEAGVKAGWFWLLAVADDGCGIDEKNLQKIFEPYFTTKEVGQGSGMGLAVVHGIVSKCGGFIQVKSRLGQGSEFKVFLPLLSGRVPVAAAPAPRQRWPGGREKILLVDDEPTLVALHRRVLESLGYQVTALDSSLQALKLLRADPDFFDLLISDQSMPGLSGAELARQALQLRPELRIIICTGFSAVLSEAEARHLGVKKYLAKPLGIEKLAGAVREVLDQP